MDDDVVQRLAGPRVRSGTAAAACGWLLAGTACYGAVFGIWRSPEQACVSAVKMPLFVFLLVAFSALINVLLANVLGARLSSVQVTLCVLMGLAVTAIILLAVSPIMLFFALQCPPPSALNAMRVYWALLIAHTAVIGVAGVIGNVRLYRLLTRLIPSPNVARRVLASWLLITGLAGCELSWVLSPFLAKPALPVPLLNPNAFTGNFFEYLWRGFLELQR